MKDAGELVATLERMQAAIEELAAEDPRARDVTPASTIDMRFVRELEAAGLLRQLYP